MILQRQFREARKLFLRFEGYPARVSFPESLGEFFLEVKKEKRKGWRTPFVFVWLRVLKRLESQRFETFDPEALE